jgi:hypothetical protein
VTPKKNERKGNEEMKVSPETNKTDGPNSQGEVVCERVASIEEWDNIHNVHDVNEEFNNRI